MSGPRNRETPSADAVCGLCWELSRDCQCRESVARRKKDIHFVAVAALDDDMVIESDTEARQKFTAALKRIAEMTDA